MSNASELSDEQWVKARYPEVVAERMFCGTPMLIWSGGIGKRGTCLGRHGMGDEALAWADAATKLGRRLEPEPDAAGERDIALIEACKALCWMCARGMDFEWSKGDPIHWELPDGARTRHVEGRCEAEKIRRLMLLSAPRNSALQEAAKEMADALKAIKIRIAFIGWPAERKWEVEPGFTITDWREEIALLEAALSRFRALGGE